MPTGVYKRTEKHRLILQQNAKGNLGVKHIRRVDYEEHRVASKEKWLKDRNPRWAGDKPSYRAVHQWVQLKLGKASKCVNCKIEGLNRYHWANRSKKYKRDLDDWKELCPKCNWASDHGKLEI